MKLRIQLKQFFKNRLNLYKKIIIGEKLLTRT